jgi:D-amino-acid dehydrogenase
MRVIVVGSGSVGLCTAYYALQKGHQVTVLERGGPDRDCCSLGNAGLVVPSHFVPLAAPGMVGLGLRMMLNPASPFYIRPRLSRDLLEWGWRFCRAANPVHVARAAPLLCDLNVASRSCYEELAERSDNEFGLVRKGLLMLCRTEERLHEEARMAKMARQLGLTVDVLTPEEAARLEPALRMEIAGAVYFADDCHLVPPRFLAWLTRALEAGGACISWSTEVTGWRLPSPRRGGAGGRGRIEAVRTTRGEFSADEYVLAAGSWSPQLLRDLHLRLPMQPGKGYSVTLPQPRRLPAHCLSLAEARVAATPMGTALRFAGTMELAGLNPSINATRVNAILQAVPRYFPEFGPDDFRGVPAWSGLRPCSADGLPYVGRFGRYTNLCAATGHSMMGLSLGPITGKLIAEILSGESPSLDVSALSPDRYA